MVKKIQVKNRDVRLNCMCALCINELTGKKIISPDRIRLGVFPKEIIPLGNYAVGITWNDGHSSGIYSYKLFDSL